MLGTIEEVLDPVTVRQLRELGGESQPDLFDELLTLYLADGRRRIREMQEAQARSDWPILEYACHALKSGSVNIGANALAELCHHLEVAVRDDRGDSVRSYIGRIAEEFHIVEQSAH